MKAKKKYTTVPHYPRTANEFRKKGSWGTRHYGREVLHPLKDKNGNPTPYALQAKRWGFPVPETAAQARSIAAECRRYLDIYRKMKNKKKTTHKK